MKLIIAFLLTFSCLANFNGKWSGEGFYQTPKTVGKCLEVFMQFKVTKDRFSILDGGYICGEIQASYPPSSFKVLNGELFYLGENVGTISENEININYDNGIYHLRLVKENGEIRFQENWDDGEDYLSISSKISLLL